MIVAGVGCRRGTSADEIEQVVRMALGMFQLRPSGSTRSRPNRRRRPSPPSRSGARAVGQLVACTSTISTASRARC
jgi:cobalt-precorrin 5A hydrolase